MHAASGQFRKTIRGKDHYFGPIEDWQGALDRYNAAKDALKQGMPIPVQTGTAVPLGLLVNHFRAEQAKRLAAGAIGGPRFRDIVLALQGLVDYFGDTGNPLAITPEMWSEYRAYLASEPAGRAGVAGQAPQPMGPARLRERMSNIRTLSRWSSHLDRALIPRPFRFADKFDPPAKKEVEGARAARERAAGDEGISAAEVRRVLAYLDELAAEDKWSSRYAKVMRCQVLLALNGGFYSSELSVLTIADVTRPDGIISTTRRKTGEQRVVPLWPRTIAAIAEAIAARPGDTEEHKVPVKYRDRLFLTRRRLPITREEHTDLTDEGGAKVTVVDALGAEFSKVLRQLGIKRPGLSFGALRSTAYSLMGPDADARALIVGHAMQHAMTKHYQKRLPELYARLRATAGLVESAIFADESPAQPRKQGRAKRQG
ncbi:MAG TPA: hypothetical protein VGB55_08080 [Tepidisphaeraceae bacterium]